MTSVDVQCTAVQRQFLEAVLFDDALDVVGFGGSRGNGKTLVSCLAMVLRRLTYAKTRGLMIRRTQSASDQNLKDEILKVFDLLGIPHSAVRYKVNDHIFVFPNGSTIKLGYCKLDSDYQQYMGTEYADIVFEELTQHPETAWNLVGGSNRSNNPKCKPKRWFTCNPGGVGHLWVRQRYVDVEHPSILFIQSLFIDSMAVLENDPGYCRRVLDPLPEWQRRQWRDGDWQAVANAYFSLNPALVRDMEIPYWAEWYAGVDWGRSAPFSVIFLAKWKDRVGKTHCHAVYEIYRANLELDEQAEEVHETEEYLRSKQLLNRESVLYYADPAVSKKLEGVSTEAGRTIRSTWANHGFYVLPAHTNSRVPGWELLKYLLHKEILTISPSCKALQAELTSAMYEGATAGGQPTSEDLDKQSALGSHALDALRYALVSTLKIGFKEEEQHPFLRIA